MSQSLTLLLTATLLWLVWPIILGLAGMEGLLWNDAGGSRHSNWLSFTQAVPPIEWKEIPANPWIPTSFYWMIQFPSVCVTLSLSLCVCLCVVHCTCMSQMCAPMCVCNRSQVTSLECVTMKLSATGVKAWTITSTEHAQWPFDWQPGAVDCVFVWVKGIDAKRKIK